MGFVLDGLDTEDYDRQYSDKELLKRIISYFKPYNKQMVLVGVMIALNSLAGTASPILIAASCMAGSVSKLWRSASSRMGPSEPQPNLM